MAFDSAEIEALKERVAQLAPAYVPDADALHVGTVFRPVVVTGSAPAVSAAPGERAQSASAREAEQAEETLTLEEPPLSDEALDEVIATPKPRAPEPAPADTPRPTPARTQQAAAEGTGDEVGAVHEKHKEWRRRIEEYDIIGFMKEPADDNVHEDRGVPMITVAKNQKAETKRGKEQKDAAYMFLLQRQLNALYAEIEAIDRQIEKNNEALDAIREIRLLEARGAFDPNDPKHRKLLETAGVSAVEYEQNGEEALAEREAELNAENERLGREKEAKVEEIREIEASADPEDVEAYYETKELRSDNIDIRAQMRAVQKNDGVADTDEINEQQERRTETMGVDGEIEQFMKDFAELDKIEDPRERLKAEKDLVAGLSADAAENLSWEPSTEHLFQDGYFDPLNEQKLASAAVTSPATGVPSP